MINNIERQYANSLRSVLAEGVKTPTRTGINTLAKQHQYFHIKNILEDFPILKGKKMYPKMALKELMWFFLGRTDVAWLQERGVSYWNNWAGDDGTIGKSYGYQYRNFNGVDNLKLLIDTIIKDPLGRRHILSIWNPADLHAMTLPPCVIIYQFSLVPMEDFKNSYWVDMHVWQRSADSFIGVPYDFMLVGFFSQFVSTMVEIKTENNLTLMPRDIHYTCNDYHIYENHIDAVNQYLLNVKENKEKIIDHKSHLWLLRPDNEFYLGDCCINDYVNYLDKSNFKIITNHKNVYPPIKAEIAI